MREDPRNPKKALSYRREDEDRLVGSGMYGRLVGAGATPSMGLSQYRGGLIGAGWGEETEMDELVLMGQAPANSYVREEAHKLHQARAIDWQQGRANPLGAERPFLIGSGATPSMGLSQYRGGHMSDDYCGEGIDSDEGEKSASDVEEEDMMMAGKGLSHALYSKHGGKKWGHYLRGFFDAGHPASDTANEVFSKYSGRGEPAAAPAPTPAPAAPMVGLTVAPIIPGQKSEKSPPPAAPAPAPAAPKSEKKIPKDKETISLKILRMLNKGGDQETKMPVKEDEKKPNMSQSQSQFRGAMPMPIIAAAAPAAGQPAAPAPAPPAKVEGKGLVGRGKGRPGGGGNRPPGGGGGGSGSRPGGAPTAPHKPGGNAPGGGSGNRPGGNAPGGGSGNRPGGGSGNRPGGGSGGKGGSGHAPSGTTFSNVAQAAAALASLAFDIYQLANAIFGKPYDDLDDDQKQFVSDTQNEALRDQQGLANQQNLMRQKLANDANKELEAEVQDRPPVNLDFENPASGALMLEAPQPVAGTNMSLATDGVAWNGVSTGAYEGQGIAKKKGRKPKAPKEPKAPSTRKPRPSKATGARQKRNEVVKRIMKEKGMKMIEASKYVKEHKLY